MFLRRWEELPEVMRKESVKKYYEILNGKRGYLCRKRLFDIMAALLMLLILIPIFIIVGICIKVDSKGPILFCQLRVTQYGRRFQIYKFRTMYSYGEKQGSNITVKKDKRITRVGKYLRRFRLDEIPQLINILKGDMSFVGTRPEVEEFVECYTDEMLATLLLPAGVTSKASILFRNEEQMFLDTDHADELYRNVILPEKMIINIQAITEVSLKKDLKIMLGTIAAMVKKDSYEKIIIETAVTNKND